MSSLFTLKSLLALLGLVVLLLLAVAAKEFRLYERAWFTVQEWHHEAHWKDVSLWLPDYRVVIDGLELEDLEDVSALTYDPDRKSLFTVTNRDMQLVELSLDGRILRRIALRGFVDPEAVEYIGPGVYVISDEREQRLVRVQIDEQTRELDASAGQQISLGIGTNGNKGFEGLAYDPQGHRLFVAKERDPVRIYEIRGFPLLDPQQPFAVHVANDPQRDARLFVRDISSLHYDVRTGHLLALSDESRLALELNADGEPISSLSLLRGQHGLKRSVPQAEGLTSDDEGNLYLVSEPNLFYVFKKKAE
ncbi:SdiA-regulated domain-containing protein [Zestomonas thermotolerans]|uniref:SdiA-regulated domain-containing protein n=1 Tax=Zestomonas thermotolerans TaxID=157784 RepID=UPI0023F2B969|nr:SdiA-regulated domain-containing protein [Pseudomonas thermotolerans]